MSEPRIPGKKVAVLIESDYYEPEIHYYQRRFPEEGAEVHFLSRLWGQPSLTFTGHEWRAPFEAHESFEDADTAAVMNELFVNVKVDREERPDVDASYMEAVQAMTGRGGGPMTGFLAPDGPPI